MEPIQKKGLVLLVFGSFYDEFGGFSSISLDCVANHYVSKE
jgi:hypothetical protein